MNFIILVNHSVKILGGRLYLPCLMDVVSLISHTFACNFSWVDAFRGKKKKIQANVWKARKIN